MVLKLVTHLLLEKQVVVVGNSLSLVSGVVLALKELLKPLDFAFTLITMVPTSILENIIASIFPMLVGISSEQFTQLKQ